MTNISLGLHVLFAAILVGGQLLLFYAVVPSTWLIEDEKLRRGVTRVVTTRFAWLAAAAIVGLVITGLFQFYQDTLVPPDVRENMMDFRFGAIFSAKMTLFVVLVVLIAVHGIYFGRRIGRMSKAVAAGEAEPGDLERLRRNSLLFSAVLLLISIVLIFLGATLSNNAYTDQPI